VVVEVVVEAVEMEEGYLNTDPLSML